MVPTGTLSRLAVALAVMTMTLVFSANPCFAKVPQPADSEPFAPTDHIIGDALARGIECVLNPMHLGLSRMYFWIAEPSVPEHTTNIRIVESPSEPQEHADQ